MAYGQQAVVIDFTTVKNVTNTGTKKNVLTLKITDNTEVDYTGNYTITYECGDLIITKRPITLTANNLSRKYNGEPLTSFPTDFTYTPYDDGVGLLDGHVITVTFDGEQTNAGLSDTVISSVTIKEGEEDVTANYAIECVKGTLTVDRKEVCLTTIEGSKTYDGNELFALGYENPSTTDAQLITGHSFVLFDSVSLVNAGTKVNALVYIICDAYRNDMSNNYTIEYTYGTLTVNPRPITVTTGSKSWVYDGADHDYENFTISDDLVDGQQAVVIDFTTVKNVTDTAPKKNVLTLKITDNTGVKDYTGNYAITYKYGDLEITKRPITLTAMDLQKEYDSTSLRSSGSKDFTYTPYGDGVGLLDGHVIAVFFDGEQTNVGSSDTEISSVTIKEGEEDVTANYDIECVKGTLTVIIRAITVTSARNDFNYSGEEYVIIDTVSSGSSNSWFTLAAGSLYDGCKLTVAYDEIADTTNVTRDATGEVVWVWVTIRSEDCTIVDATENDVTEMYDITAVDGQLLRIKPKKIIIYIEFDAEDKYTDGSPLKNGDYYCAPGQLLGEDHITLVQYVDEQDVVKIENASGNDVTKNYAIYVQ